MAPKENTSIAVKEPTRKRVAHIAESKKMSYDRLINWLLDELSFPTGEEIDHLITENASALVEGGF